MNIRKSLSLGLMAAAGLCVGTTAQPAHAATTPQLNVVSVTLMYNTSGAQFYLQLSDGGSYTAYVTSSYPSCNRSWDLVKSWLSMAQAAQLSGKKVSLQYTIQSSCYNSMVINAVAITT